MDLPTIQEMWKKDSVIDKIMLDEASLKIPQLHQKYLVLLNEFNLLHMQAVQHVSSCTPPPGLKTGRRAPRSGLQ